MIATMEEHEVASTEQEPRWKTAGDPYLLTRAEVIDELAARGIQTTDRQLKRWATYGLLPSPIRRVPPGSPEGQPYALYPPWIIGVVKEILARLRTGRTIEDIKPEAPRMWKHWERMRGEFTPGFSGYHTSPLVVPNLALTTLALSVDELVRKLEQYGFPAAQIDVTIRLKDDTSYTTHFDLKNILREETKD